MMQNETPPTTPPPPLAFDDSTVLHLAAETDSDPRTVRATVARMVAGEAIKSRAGKRIERAVRAHIATTSTTNEAAT